MASGEIRTAAIPIMISSSIALPVYLGEEGYPVSPSSSADLPRD